MTVHLLENKIKIIFLTFFRLIRNNHTIMSCCPKTAWGELKNPNYQEKGQVERVCTFYMYLVYKLDI